MRLWVIPLGELINDALDVLNKSHLAAALRFTMQTSDGRPSMVSYYDGDFKVDVMFENDDVQNVIITREYDIDNRKVVDHNLSGVAEIYLKTQHRKFIDQQNRLQQLSNKFGS